MTSRLSAQTRVLAVIEALAGHEVTGLRLKEVADAVGAGCAASTILRDLETLEAAGWAQKSREDRWMLAARPIQVLHHFYGGLKAAESRAAEVAANYTNQVTGDRGQGSVAAHAEANRSTGGRRL